MLKSIRAEFPILSEKVNGKPFIFLDSAASAQKPNSVLEAMTQSVHHCYANIHRGLYAMSEKTTEAYENVRRKIAQFINAYDAKEIIFTSNSTAGINLLANTLGTNLKSGQKILISELEHHANIVPWLMLRDRHGVEFRVVPIDDKGDIDLEIYEAELAKGDIALVAVTHMSNVLGTITPAKKLAQLAHQYGAKILLDASQSIVHSFVDVQDLEADFIVFTGHKLYGPTGVGVLWGRSELLEELPPFMGGGEMIETVSFESVSWASIPHRFEAGTPPILEVLGLGAVIDFLNKIGRQALLDHETHLVSYASEAFGRLKDVTVLGAPQKRGGVFSFVMQRAHPHDLAVLLDQQNIAVRAGQHCAEPLINRLGIKATTRASFALYTTESDIDALMLGLEKARAMLV
ncbi:aminotransferase class V-fold PLP-dependent enzyme [Aristophania vespae]|uniref:aminotransferase class V-fold PLP-dependent enzyme n=1 Tax=Aristophania vespae TaxID=2697033 RepID=UPI002351A6AD|nr:SufS family cysteine desulfurase [Aristophania vespae]UMM63392.1 Cysteine desulfurase [Aristophania vespae]